jgi:hypothetical protein
MLVEVTPYIYVGYLSVCGYVQCAVRILICGVPVCYIIITPKFIVYQCSG